MAVLIASGPSTARPGGLPPAPAGATGAGAGSFRRLSSSALTATITDNPDSSRPRSQGASPAEGTQIREP